MRTRRWLQSILLVAMLVPLARGSTSSWPAGPGLDAPGRQVVFQISSTVGFGNSTMAMSTRPSVTVYGNGDAYISSDRFGSVGFTKGSVPLDKLRDLVEAVNKGDLFDPDDDGPTPADGGTATFAFRPTAAPARTVTTWASDAIYAFQLRLDRSIEGRSVWTPSRIDVTDVEDPSEAVTRTAARWPGKPLRELLADSPRGRCGALSGSAARTLYDVATRHLGARWVDHGRRYMLVLRALLPGEAGCRH